MFRPLALLLLLLLAPLASAIDLAGTDVLVPVVSRVPGAFGTFWRTDLTITSLATSPVTAPVTLTLTDNSGGEVTADVRVDPGETAVLSDLVKNTFGREQAIGALRVRNLMNVRLLVRARIYTTHPAAGEFGQIVQGLPVDKLGMENDLSGFTVSSGARVNVGIASPLGAATATLRIRDRFGVIIGRPFEVAIPRGGVVQLNDAMRHFQTEPLEGGSIHVTATQPVYAYASVVRNDSGDPLFIIGTESPRPNNTELPTSCANPAKLSLAPENRGADGWLVMFKEGTDTVAETIALALKYGFTVQATYPSIRVFYAHLRKETVAALRCEPSVLLIEQNGMGGPAATSPRFAGR
jgi:hypothetical protein